MREWLIYRIVVKQNVIRKIVEDICAMYQIIPCFVVCLILIRKIIQKKMENVRGTGE